MFELSRHTDKKCSKLNSSSALSNSKSVSELCNSRTFFGPSTKSTEMLLFICLYQAIFTTDLHRALECVGSSPNGWPVGFLCGLELLEVRSLMERIILV